MNTEYEGKEWIYAKIIPHIEASSASEVQTVVCIKENRLKVGSYQDGQSAYKLNWDVRLVQWLDGKVVAATTLIGSDPPLFKNVSGPGYGRNPTGELINWLIAAGLGEQMILYGGDRVASVAFAPDGKSLAFGKARLFGVSYPGTTFNGIVTLWDVATGQVLRTFRGHTDSVNSVTFAPDGKILASASEDNTVKLWNVTTGQLLRTLSGGEEPVNSVTFAPDGKILASASQVGTVTLWDLTTGQVLDIIPEGGTVVAFAPDGKTLASAGLDTVKLWDVATGRTVLTIRMGHQGQVNSLTYASDGMILASGSLDHTVKLWEVATGKKVYTLNGHTDSVNNVAFAPDGKTLASASEDNTVRLWDVATGEMLLTLKGHTDSVNSVAFTLDGKTLASGSSDETVRLWDMAIRP